MSPVKEELVVLEDKIMVEEKDPVEVIPEADINKNEEPKKEEDKKDKIFVRPRFVKVKLYFILLSEERFIHFPGGTEHNQEAAGGDHS